MQIYPAIDIKDEKCVRLTQGAFDEVTVFREQPEEVAREFQAAGATFIHVVDLDGARMGAAHNRKAIERIRQAVQIPIQNGGGIRTLLDVQEKLDMGIDRVILGTAALKSPEVVKEALARFGSSRIAVGVDASNGFVAVEGWGEVSGVTAVDLCLKMKDMGILHVIYTDIAKDGMMAGPSLSSTEELIQKTDLQIIASGGVSSMADVEAVGRIGASGVIIGKAIYLGAVDLKAVIRRFQEVQN